MNHIITSYIEELFPRDATRVTHELRSILSTLPRFRPQPKDIYWYKQINLYIVYPDAIRQSNEKPLQSLISHLGHVASMGFNAVHVLPFLDSPMIDKGFDIRNFYKVREDLGSFDDLLYFKDAAERHRLHVFMDLVFNHVSDEHTWFQKAQSGDAFYREYFLYAESKPEYVRKFQKDAGVWAEYIVDGAKEHVYIMFPEYVGEIPHWRQGDDGYWYYHTFYPQQLDMNWFNPNVFMEYAKILIHWASLGFHFRLDAIPFVGKRAYKKVAKGHERTHLLVKTLHAIAHTVNPECVFIVETYEDIPSIIQYFGSNESKQTELAYNFHLCAYLWASLLKQNNTYIWDRLLQTSLIPVHAAWLNFLRNHDELAFDYMNETLNRELTAQLVSHGGHAMRDGVAVTGRTFSLLGSNIKRFLMAYFLLASLPGALGVPYGDEFGFENIPLDQLPEEERLDARNVNRGVLDQERMTTLRAKKVQAVLSRMIHARHILQDFFRVKPKKVYQIEEKDAQVFAASYAPEYATLLVLVNLSDQVKHVDFDITGYRLEMHIHKVHIDYNLLRITLGPYAGAWLKKKGE